MTEALTAPMTEDTLFELLSLECLVDPNGTLRYYNARGELHRRFGPAVEYRDGNRVWYQNGQMHREHGPAIEYSDGSRAWWQNDRRHRIDGPAIEYLDGYRAWYVNGRPLAEAEWQRAVASMGRV